jgi:PAS domain S-box-containing protein
MKPETSKRILTPRKFESQFICTVIGVFLTSFLLLVHPANSEQAKETKHVLILITGQKDLAGYILSEKGMRAAFDQSKDFQFEYFIEYMDRYRFSDAAYQNDMFEMYRTKYSSKKIDLVIAHGYFALDFAVAKGDEIFPNTPVIFSTIMKGQLKRLNLNPKHTGSLLKIDYLGLLNSALQNHPDTRHVVIISGTSKVGRLISTQSRNVYASYAEQYDFISLGHLPMDDLLATVANLPEKTVIIYYYMALDGNSQSFKPWKVASIISEATNAPVYGMADTYLGHGIVGGNLISYEAQGKRAGEIGLRVLKGEKPADIPITSEGTILNMFDWHQLKRWGIHESKLPEGSIILYKELSFWESYRWYIIGIIAFIFLLGGIISTLLFYWNNSKQREQQLTYSHNRFRAYMKNSVEGIWCIEFDENIDIDLPEDEQFELVYKHGYFSDANDAYARAVGLEYGREVIGTRIESFCPRSDPTNVATVKAWIQSRYSITDAETVQTHKDGITRNILNNATGIINSGRVEQVWGTQLDITDLKKTEQQLIKTEQKYRTIADHTYDWEYWEAPDGRLKYVSPSCERITGYSVTDFMNFPGLIFTIIIPEDRLIWKRHGHGSNTASGTNASHIHFRIKDKNGHIHWIAHVCQHVFDEQGENLGVRASNRDITVLRRTEKMVNEHLEMLSQVERRETLGQLTGSIAHELNQPLTGILSDAQAGELLLKKEGMDKGQIEEIFTDIVADAKRASLVLRNLRALFSGDRENNYDQVNINELIRETLQILNSEFVNRDLLIKADLFAGLPKIAVNRIQIQQVLINLIKNSWQAFQHSEKKNRQLSITTTIANGNQVTVCLEDNGPGIDPDELQSVFDTLKTTKKDGMGMGLPICKSILQAHGGRIWAENIPGGGAGFQFSLPVRR